ncbi:MAG TPA: cellulase family glycosylhydrolase [Paludibacteraceae bacterium]|nr:cellulase family glycosylhydrolase [Paludibacteraceae bacterium]
MNKFKRSFIHFLAVIQIFTLISCKEQPVIEPEIQLAKEVLDISKESQTALLAIKTNLTWTAVSSQPWCTLTPASGEAGTKQISVAVTANTAPTPREALITIAAGKLSKQVKVVQALTNSLSVATKTYDIAFSGADITVAVQSTAAFTTIIQPAWITLKSTSGDGKTQVFTVAENTSKTPRQGIITFSLDNITETVTMRQSARDFSIPADKTGMESDALVLAKKMTLGWNLGNSLEAIGSETVWGNPKTSKALIDAVKTAGFNAVRIPCAWNGYIEDPVTYTIKDSWLLRVKEVVDYCVNNNMYVILNIHWDGGWLEENPTYAKQAEVNAKQKALWEQISIYFRNYDEHLMFAGTNEVHAGYGNPTPENIIVQLSYNQTFVNAVRSTGGRNTYRNLVVQAYNTNIDLAVSSLKMATDNVANRMMAEVHYYDPWDFCGDTGNTAVTLWGEPFKIYGKVSTWGQEADVDKQFAKMKTNFVNKGYPVILGEYAPTRRLSLSGEALTHHLDSRAYYLKYVTQQAKNNGIVPFYWDNGAIGDNGSGIFNRSNGTIADDKAYNALLQGSAAGIYPY